MIDNSAANAITRNSGHIISEGENNRIKWNIGTATGTYTIPWGYGNTDYIPLTFTKTAGTGSGHFLFSTYHTSWNNIAQLPTGVTNINGASGTDNSAYRIRSFLANQCPKLYALSLRSPILNLRISILKMHRSNTIIESGLRAKRYNSSLNSWTDNMLASTLNTQPINSPCVRGCSKSPGLVDAWNAKCKSLLGCPVKFKFKSFRQLVRNIRRSRKCWHYLPLGDAVFSSME